MVSSGSKKVYLFGLPTGFGGNAPWRPLTLRFPPSHLGSETSSTSLGLVSVTRLGREAQGARGPLPPNLTDDRSLSSVEGTEGLPEKIVVETGGKLDITIIVLPGASARIPLTVDIEGPDAEVSLKGIYISSGTDEVTFDITVNHLVGGSISRQLFNGLAAGEAKCAFFGKIVVAQDAQRTEAYQENHNIVLSDDARVNTKPQLEIYADDVKCSHGATVGRLNEDEQFYMRSRGIPEDEAKILQMISFVAPVLSDLEDEALSATVESAIRSLVVA